MPKTEKKKEKKGEMIIFQNDLWLISPKEGEKKKKKETPETL